MKAKSEPKYTKEEGLQFYMNPFWKLVAVVFFLCGCGGVGSYFFYPPQIWKDYLFLALIVVVTLAALYVSLVQMSVLVRLLPDGVHLSWFGKEFRFIPKERISCVYVEDRDKSGRNPFVLLASDAVSRSARLRGARWGVYHGPFSFDLYANANILWIFPLFHKYLPALRDYFSSCDLTVQENSQY